MVDILEEYIQKLIENQNYGAGEYTVHLKDKEDYYALLQPVYEYYKRERALTRDELYQGLLDDSSLKNKKSVIASETKQSIQITRWL